MSINLSLTTLGMCINARADPTATHVPFRDSKLTRLLQARPASFNLVSSSASCKSPGVLYGTLLLQPTGAVAMQAVTFICACSAWGASAQAYLLKTHA